MLRLLWAVVGLAALLCCAAPAVCGGVEPDFLMDSDPVLQVPKSVPQFNPALKALWLEALNRPEVDMQRMAAETIARAHEYGVPDLQAAIPRLEQIVQDAASHPAARFAAARALIVLNSRNSAGALWTAAQAYGSDLRQLIEPALADWDYAPARDVWIARLTRDDTRRRELLLAIRGLGQVQDAAALPQLVELTADLMRSPDVRLTAAAAAGRIAESGLEGDADRLAAADRTPQFVNQLCAVRLLSRHTSEAARQRLLDLAGHSEPVVAAAALQRLNAIDPALVVPLAETAMASSDPHVRREGATAYLTLPSAERIVPLSRRLADPDPELRRDVCAGLLRLSETPEFNAAIRDAAQSILAGDRWQGQEQAALLLGALEHKPAAARLVELLESPRPEVAVIAAWALRKVAVPETIPALIDKAARQTERRKQERLPEIELQVAHLFEALGVLQATDAMPLLMEYVPKQHSTGGRSRGAAVWAIGRLKAGARDAELENTFVERINDFDDKFPELVPVKQMCAVALARMNAVDQAPMLRALVMNVPMSIQLDVALRWAVQELTGEELPPPEPLPFDQGNWFLEPYP